MEIEGYRPHGKRHESDELHVHLSFKLVDFLTQEGAGANRKDVRKVATTLENIRRNGLQGMSNNTLFVREGKFPSGRPGLADVAVYAVKSFQVRVYGGIIRIKGASVFLCPDGAVKKKDLADRAQLERVAKVLGEYHER
jgi:hypothetical protein